jgi:hypothetical protein
MYVTRIDVQPHPVRVLHHPQKGWKSYFGFNELAVAKLITQMPTSQMPTSQVPTSQEPTSIVPISQVPISQVLTSQVPTSKMLNLAVQKIMKGKFNVPS